MAILNKEMQDMGKQALENDEPTTHSGASVHTPRFMPQALLDLGVCKSAADLEKTQKALKDFREVVSLTKKKFKAQETAADLALELAKSQNALIAYFAQTVIKQAKSDAELAALLQALPAMLTGIQETVTTKKEAKVRDFTARLNAAGKGRTTDQAKTQTKK
jgi:hypothetical protein